MEKKKEITVKEFAGATNRILKSLLEFLSKDDETDVADLIITFYVIQAFNILKNELFGDEYKKTDNYQKTGFKCSFEIADGTGKEETPKVCHETKKRKIVIEEADDEDLPDWLKAVLDTIAEEVVKGTMS